MPEDPVTPRSDYLRPLTFFEWVSGVVGLAAYVGATAGLFYAAVWLLRLIVRAVR